MHWPRPRGFTMIRSSDLAGRQSDDTEGRTDGQDFFRSMPPPPGRSDFAAFDRSPQAFARSRSRWQSAYNRSVRSRTFRVARAISGFVDATNVRSFPHIEIASGTFGGHAAAAIIPSHGIRRAWTRSGCIVFTRRRSRRPLSRASEGPTSRRSSCMIVSRLGVAFENERSRRFRRAPRARSLLRTGGHSGHSLPSAPRTVTPADLTASTQPQVVGLCASAIRRTRIGCSRVGLETPCRFRFRAFRLVYEIPALPVRQAFDARNVVEVESYHRQTLL